MAIGLPFAHAQDYWYRSLSKALVKPEQVFQLKFGGGLRSLPAELGQLKYLDKLDLRSNKQEKGPNQPGWLVADDSLSDKAKKEIKQLLPNCEILFP